MNYIYGLLSEIFPISAGVKQGGMLSPSLFHAVIADLIYECTNENISAHINRVNVSKIDDIILLSSVDSHLQKLVDTCDVFSEFCRIEFNATKSNTAEFGPQFFKNSDFLLNNTIIPIVESIICLGVKIDNKLNFNRIAVFFLGLKPNSISPHLQSFMYKTHCLSQFTYSLETTALYHLNITQNTITRHILVT